MPWTLYFILHAFLHPIITFFSQHMPIPSHSKVIQKNINEHSIYVTKNNSKEENQMYINKPVTKKR